MKQLTTLQDERFLKGFLEVADRVGWLENVIIPSLNSHSTLGSSFRPVTFLSTSRPLTTTTNTSTELDHLTSYSRSSYHVKILEIAINSAGRCKFTKRICASTSSSERVTSLTDDHATIRDGGPLLCPARQNGLNAQGCCPS